jgi:hypothetical protein
LKLTAAQVRNVLDYDPGTGIFTWKVRTGMPPYWNPKYAGKRAGSLNCQGYCHIAIDSKNYKAHRLAWLYHYGEMPRLDIDHINGDKSDNSIANLRIATDSQNLANAKMYSGNTSGVKGVAWDARSRKWKAYVRLRGTYHHLGYFTNIADAARARLAGAERLQGEFTRAV